MRTRNKKIVLVESIQTYQTEKQSKFIEQNDAVIPMRIYQHEMQGQGHLAEIFYEALLNETINKKQQNDPLTYRSIKSTTLETDASEKRLNAGKIIRRSLSKNCSKSTTPQKDITQKAKAQTPLIDITGKSKIQERITSTKIANKQNSKTAASCDKAVKSARRPISNKKQIKYQVKTNIRS